MISNNPSDTTVLVTGASGWIAMHCILQLLEAGYRVRGTIRNASREETLCAALAEHTKRLDRLEFAVADLTQDAGWDEAVTGCPYVLHVASPVPLKPPDHEDELIIPAREGALRVLKAASKARVKRVVLTSSVAAIYAGHVRDGSKVFDENDWSNLDGKVSAYAKSKTLAERAAWDFVNGLKSDEAFELSVINPALVLGPVFSDDFSASGEVIRKLMKRELPGCPALSWGLVDVRDIAAAHLAAMTIPEAAGKRFCCSLESVWLSEIAEILSQHFSKKGYKIPTRKFPNFMMRFVAIFDKTVRLVVDDLGIRTEFSNAQARKTLNWQPRSKEEMIVAMGESMIKYGVV